MKNKTLLALGWLCWGTSAWAGTWSVAPWTNDASTGIVAGETLWAYHFGTSTPATVDEVAIPGLATSPVSVMDKLEIAGATLVIPADDNQLTALGGTGSAVMARSFFYGGNPSTTVTVKAGSPLAEGKNYVVSFFSVGWDAAPTTRQVRFHSGADQVSVNQNVNGENAGVRVDYLFTAGTGDQTVTIDMDPTIGTFHLYAVALRMVPDALVVTTTADSGPGSLRQVMDSLSTTTPTTITFAPNLAGQSIPLSGGEITVNATVTLDATSLPQGLTLQGNGVQRLFLVNTSGRLTARGLTLTGGGGSQGFGGAIENLGTLRLHDCTLRHNTSPSGGGAIDNGSSSASVRLVNCTLHDNSANQGGALDNFQGSTQLLNCTFTRNRASVNGAAVYNEGGGTLQMVHGTLTENIEMPSSTAGVLSVVSGSVTVSHSIVAGNAGGDVGSSGGSISSGGGNVIGTGNGTTAFTQPNDVTNISAAQLGLAVLGRYGGLTDSMPPLPGSPAMDRAVDSPASSDQRGFARNRDGTFDSITVSDSGAVESEVVQVTTSSDQNDSPAGSNRSLREAVRDAPVGAVISSASGLSQWLTNRGEIVISRPLILASSSLTAGMSVNIASGRIFHVLPGVRVHFNRLTMNDGKGTGVTHSGRGGAILNQGDLSMTLCNLSGNGTDYGGAIANGMAATAVRLRMSRCSLNLNQAKVQGGALFNAASAGGTAVVELENCLISRNTAQRNGGALANMGGSGSASLTIEHCTIMENAAQSPGGGLFTSLGGASTTLTSCLIAENTAQIGGPDVQTSSGGTLTSGGTNLIGITDGSGIAWLGSDLTGTAAVPLAAGVFSEIDSYIPKSSSPVVDAAAVTTRTLLDRSNNPRSVDGDLNGTAQPDIGCFEVAAVRVTTAMDELDTPSGANVSLREAMRDAVLGVNTHVKLDPVLSGQTLILNPALGQLVTGKNLYVDASGLDGGFTMDGGSGTNRIIHHNGGVLHLRGVHLIGGSVSGDGGAILSQGTLVLENCTLADNQATGLGGAVHASAPLSVKNCSFSRNTATSHGGALSCSNGSVTLENSAFIRNASGAFGGGIYISLSTSDTNRMVQCTVAENRSAQRGGGMMISNSFMSVIHGTITRNEAQTQRGGGLVMDTGSFRQTLQNTIIADNRAPTVPEVAVDNGFSAWPLSAGGNLIGQNTGATSFFPAGLPNASGDHVGLEAAPLASLLAPAGLYGGLTPSCPPMPGSPALEKAVPVTTLNLVGTGTPAGSFITDQRGFARSVDGDFNGTARPDIGAAESVIVRVHVANDELDIPAGTNDVSLREALRDAPEGAVIGFSPALSGQTLTLNSELIPVRSVVVSGSGLPVRPTLTAVTGNRIFRLASGLSSGLSHLSLNQTLLNFDRGGAVLNEGTLSLADCGLNGNASGPSGGAITSTVGFENPKDVFLTLARCTLSGNSTQGSGGAIDCTAERAGAVHRLTLEDCVFTQNLGPSMGGAVSVSGSSGLCLSTVRRCTFTGNQSLNGFGGGLGNRGVSADGVAEALLESCTFSDNSAYAGGAVSTQASSLGTARATLKQCTITQNQSSFQGGGVHHQSSDSGSSSTLRLTQCTVVANGAGGGVIGYASNAGNSNTTTLDRSLIAGNSLPDVAVYPDPSSLTTSTVISLGTNLIGNTDGSGVMWPSADLTGTTGAPLNPMLAALGNHGGPTATMPPLPGSPARDPASGATSATGQTDQRGLPRLVGARVDIGAVEATEADAPGSIAFGGPLLRVNESATPVQIPVYRSAGSIGSVTVRVNSTHGTATSPADFAAMVDHELTFAPGETVKNLPLTLVADAKLNEAHETFTLTLSSVTGGASLGSQSSTLVRILDFTDATPPSLSLVAPLTNAIVQEASVIVIGNAGDDKGLQSVQIQLNGGAFMDAALIGTPTLSNFSLPITAVPGVNNLVVRAVDEKGKISALTKRSFTYKLPSTLTVNLIGPANSGSISNGFTPTSSRDVGLTYSITATPKPGFIFTGWNANQAGAIQNNGYSPLPALTFTMRPSLILTAGFASIASYAPAVAGIYQGLITPESTGETLGNHNIGWFTATTVGTTGVVSGSIRIDGLTVPFSGLNVNGVVQFGSPRSPTLTLKRPGKPDLLASLYFYASSSGNTAELYLQENLEQLFARSVARLCPFHSKNKVPTTLVSGTSQRLNLIFPSVPDQPGITAYPPGTGIGSLILGSDGSVKIAGTLADNTGFTASALLTDNQTVPLFASLYGNLGHLAGTVILVPTSTADYDAYGLNLSWCRPAQPKAPWYPQGWPKTLFVDLVGARYVMPLATANQSFLPGLGPLDATNTLGNASLTFTDGLLASPRSFPVNISSKNVVTLLPLRTTLYTLSLVPATGEISGTFTHSDLKKPTFRATTIQKPGEYRGTYGFFMSIPPNATSTAGQAGAAMLLPR